ncbi:hypothetical protein [Methanosarcina sp.]
MKNKEKNLVEKIMLKGLEGTKKEGGYREKGRRRMPGKRKVKPISFS